MRVSTGAFAGSLRGMSRNCRFLSAMDIDVRRFRALRGPPQVLDQRVDRGCLGLHDPELADEGAQVVDDLLGPGAAGLRYMLFQETFQMLQMRLHRLSVDAADIDELVVIPIHEVA